MTETLFNLAGEYPPLISIKTIGNGKQVAKLLIDGKERLVNVAKNPEHIYIGVREILPYISSASRHGDTIVYSLIDNPAHMYSFSLANVVKGTELYSLKEAITVHFEINQVEQMIDVVGGVVNIPNPLEFLYALQATSCLWYLEYIKRYGPARTVMKDTHYKRRHKLLCRLKMIEYCPQRYSYIRNPRYMSIRILYELDVKRHNVIRKLKKC